MNLKEIKWILAPMDGVTDFAYREAWYTVFGERSCMHKAVAPFMALVQGSKIKRAVLKDLWPENNRSGFNIEPQVLGNNAADFLTMNRALADMGYTQVNWNLGCPKPQVARKQRGSGLLPYPERIDGILNEVCAQSPIPLSVKIRLGYQNPEEVYPVIEVLNRYPLAYVAVHPRIGKQGYTGEADQDWFAKILPLIKAPVIYNGDIDSLPKAQVFAQKFPQIKTIMIGRGVIANPFLPCLLSGEEFGANEHKIYFCRFVRELWKRYSEKPASEQAALQRQKLHWSQFRGDLVENSTGEKPEAVFEKIKRFTTARQYEKFLDQLCPN